MLKRKALHATTWSAYDILLRQALQFGVSVGLARLLSPDDFGLLAMLSLFSGIATIFIDGGFSVALIQAPELSPRDESTVFWFSSLMAAAVSFLFVVSGPAIAWFFGQPILKPLAAAMALNVFISAMGSVPTALLSRRMAFRSQMKIGVVASVLSGTTAVVAAYGGLGVWALAIQILVATSVSTTGAWLASSWRPSLTFDRDSARRLFRFGGFMLSTSLLDVAYSRLYTVLIGRLYGVAELGFYSRAESTKQLPLGMMGSVVSRVSLPIFSAASADQAQLLRGVRLAVRGTMLLAAPTMLGTAAVARPLLIALFGERWSSATEVLQVLCVGGVFWPLHLININLLISQGHSRLFFQQDLAKKCLALVLLGAGSVYGVMGIACSQTAFSILSVGISVYFTRVHLGYGVVEQLKDSSGVIAAALGMAAGVVTTGALIELPPAQELGVLVVVGVLVFAICAQILRLQVIHDVRDLLRHRKG